MGADDNTRTRKPLGYNGRIAHVDLTSGRVDAEEPGEVFYRTYLGGGCMGTYYLLKEMPVGADALGPDNVLVFAPSVLTGAPIPGLSRFTVTAKSPLTGCIGDSQCGGYWGPQLKYAGFDALVVTGRAAEPVYLWAHAGAVELRPATGLAELFPKELQATLREELGEPKAEIVQNGPAGRRLVRFASVGNRGHHYAGRTGMGAVMGAKNLVAVAAHGRPTYGYADPEKVRALARRASDAYKAAPEWHSFTENGTLDGFDSIFEEGYAPVRNMSRGAFAGVAGVNEAAMKATVLRGTRTCFACVMRCKRAVGSGGGWEIDPDYGGPEYETVGMLGPNCGVADIAAVTKANELCNAYGLDTISTGAMIAFAMECFEEGLIDRSDTDGLEVRFGDARAMVELVRRIGERRGIGDVLADGFPAAIAVFGPDAEPFALHVKGLAVPAHIAQVKKTQALAYAINPFGADHMSSEHDGFLAECGRDCQALDIAESRPWEALDEVKTRFVAVTQAYYSMLDTLDLCAFCFAPGGFNSYQSLAETVEAVTGLPGDLWFLLKAGERRVALMRAFNAREGVGPEADVLPVRVFEPLPDGPLAGAHVDRKALERARADYYDMAGWERQTGRPTRAKLLELGLGWVDRMLCGSAELQDG